MKVHSFALYVLFVVELWLKLIGMNSLITFVIVIFSTVNHKKQDCKNRNKLRFHSK